MSALTNEQLDIVIRKTIKHDNEAREELFTYIWQFIGKLDLRQLGPYRRDPDCVAEVCARVVGRFFTSDYRRLREYLKRPRRSFPHLLHVVSKRVAIDLARSMRKNIAARGERQFRWVQELELAETDRIIVPDVASHNQYASLCEYLNKHADPVDVDLLRRWTASPDSWQVIARRHELTPSAARQRVARLRESLRAWLERHSN
ncbi:MAG: hypothetical protein AAGC55_27000 [Myxococcota bacterium]